MYEGFFRPGSEAAVCCCNYLCPPGVAAFPGTPRGEHSNQGSHAISRINIVLGSSALPKEAGRILLSLGSLVATISISYSTIPGLPFLGS